MRISYWSSDVCSSDLQDFLHPLLHALLDFATPRTDGVIQRHSRDDRSHGGFRHFPDSLLRIDELKLVQCRIPDIPAHGIGEIDDILVAGEHQLLARACRNIYGADFLHIYDLHRIERRGKAQVNARPHGSGIARTEEGRVGKEGVSTFRSRWSPYH